jgi:hypothetical protein
MTLAELLAKLAVGEHASDCGCDHFSYPDDIHGPGGESIEPMNSCTELARQAKELWYNITSCSAEKHYELAELVSPAAKVATGHWTTEPPTTPGWYILSRVGELPDMWICRLDDRVYYPDGDVRYWSVACWLPEAPGDDDA